MISIVPVIGKSRIINGITRLGRLVFSEPGTSDAHIIVAIIEPSVKKKGGKKTGSDGITLVFTYITVFVIVVFIVTNMVVKKG